MLCYVVVILCYVNAFKFSFGGGGRVGEVAWGRRPPPPKVFQSINQSSFDITFFRTRSSLSKRSMWAQVNEWASAEVKPFLSHRWQEVQNFSFLLLKLISEEKSLKLILGLASCSVFSLVSNLDTFFLCGTGGAI